MNSKLIQELIQEAVDVHIADGSVAKDTHAILALVKHDEEGDLSVIRVFLSDDSVLIIMKAAPEQSKALEERPSDAVVH